MATIRSGLIGQWTRMERNSYDDDILRTRIHEKIREFRLLGYTTKLLHKTRHQLRASREVTEASELLVDTAFDARCPPDTPPLRVAILVKDVFAATVSLVVVELDAWRIREKALPGKTDG